jgi:hypothetical protein
LYNIFRHHFSEFYTHRTQNSYRGDSKWRQELIQDGVQNDGGYGTKLSHKLNIGSTMNDQLEVCEDCIARIHLCSMQHAYKMAITIFSGILREEPGWDPVVQFFLYGEDDLHKMKLSTLRAKIKELKKQVRATETHHN